MLKFHHMQRLAQVSVRPVQVGPVTFGGAAFVVIAGPCAIESAGQFSRIAAAVKAAGAAMLRGGIYKLRTDPHSFEGLGEAGLAKARAVRDEVGMPFVAEVTDPRQIPVLGEVVDMFQVGTRNMFNYSLLKELGRTDKPVLLKRGFAARLEEWALAAEHVMKEGNSRVVLCERGIRTFETATRNTPDLAGALWIQKRLRLPVLLDPSHGTGRRELVIPLALAAAAAGLDGLLVEVHAEPARALSDGAQSLDFAGFAALMARLRPVLAAVSRPLHARR